MAREIIGLGFGDALEKDSSIDVPEVLNLDRESRG